MPAALASAAVLAVMRLRRDRCEPVKVLAARRRPVRATGGHAMGHILASDHGSALTVAGKPDLARRVTVSQPWPPGSGNKQSEERPSPEPINLGQRPEHSRHPGQQSRLCSKPEMPSG